MAFLHVRNYNQNIIPHKYVNHEGKETLRDRRDFGLKKDYTTKSAVRAYESRR